ncbi:hypothetical protein J4219_03920 [Candidatus Woesearchaeota archaeon]|nr:hypothetical protein [Candidatus Woesearchaeota archaeon]
MALIDRMYFCQVCSINAFVVFKFHELWCCVYAGQNQQVMFCTGDMYFQDKYNKINKYSLAIKLVMKQVKKLSVKIPIPDKYPSILDELQRYHERKHQKKHGDKCD